MTTERTAYEIAEDSRQADNLVGLAESLLRNALLPPPGTDVFLEAAQRYRLEKYQRAQKRLAAAKEPA